MKSSLITISKTSYKGHTVATVESFMQRFFVIDSNLEAAVFSMADAKRQINGQPTRYESVNITDL